MMKLKKAVCLMVLVLTVNAGADVADFEDLSLGDESHWSGTYPYDNGNDTSETVSFESGDAGFSNTSGYSWGSPFWNGWAYSNRNDIAAPGYGDQFNACATGSGGNQYGICFLPLDYAGGTYDPIPQAVGLGSVTGNDYSTTISGMWVTNVMASYLSMENGDAFAKKFGGESGDDGDFFTLTIKGVTESGYTANDVEFDLADFRFANNEQDYIVDQWTWVDLSILGDVTGLEFNLSSSDVGSFGMNTPGYFAMDNFNGSPLLPPVPEPATLALLALGGLVLRRRKA